LTHSIVQIAVALAASAVVLWLALAAILWVARPKGSFVSEALHVLPDTLRLLSRLARERTLPKAARVRVWLLLAYLACPFDLIPDFIPVIGQLGDVILICLVLRSVVRLAGPEALRQHWPGTQAGLSALWRFAGLPGPVAVE
jgi:uncharacterized membrane protein YkvA (DUF1232 family)